MNYQRIYEYRFRNVDQTQRSGAWREIAADVWDRLGSPRIVLDPAAGRGEFINAVQAAERWAVDQVDMRSGWDANIQFIRSSALEAELPADHFDGVWVSNFLEHLPTQDAVAAFLEKMFAVTRPGGRIAVMGPNFRYCAREYFDFADHVLALTHVAVEEHLWGAGFNVLSSNAQFLPYSFRQGLPPHPLLVRAYLRIPLAWRVFGKQFLVIGQKPGASAV